MMASARVSGTVCSFSMVRVYGERPGVSSILLPLRVPGEARGGNDAGRIVDDEQRSMGPQSPCAQRVRGAAGPSASLPLLRDDSHRGRRGASRPTPRRHERDPCDYSDTLLAFGAAFSALTPRALQEGAQTLAAGGVAQLAQRLALDLADALAGDRERLADFLERVLATVADAEAHFEDHLLARRQGLQHFLRLLLQVELDDRVDWRRHRAVLDEIPEMGVLFLADRGLERNRLLGDLQDLADL